MIGVGSGSYTNNMIPKIGIANIKPPINNIPNNTKKSFWSNSCVIVIAKYWNFFFVWFFRLDSELHIAKETFQLMKCLLLFMSNQLTCMLYAQPINKSCSNENLTSCKREILISMRIVPRLGFFSGSQAWFKKFPPWIHGFWIIHFGYQIDCTNWN